MQAALKPAATMAPAMARSEAANPVVSLTKSPGKAPEADRSNQEREPEALTAALSMVAIVLTLLTSLAMKLLLG